MKLKLPILLAAAGGSAMLAAGAAVADEDRIMKANPTAEDFIDALSPKEPRIKTRGIRTREQDPVEPVYSDLPMITFEFDSAELTPAARDVLDELAAALKSEQLGSSRFMVEGHTDAVGVEGYNQSLSEARARAVREYLVQREVESVRIDVIGKGESELLEPVDGPSVVNRRVRVVNIGGS